MSLSDGLTSWLLRTAEAATSHALTWSPEPGWEPRVFLVPCGNQCGMSLSVDHGERNRSIRGSEAMLSISMTYPMSRGKPVQYGANELDRVHRDLLTWAYKCSIEFFTSFQVVVELMMASGSSRDEVVLSVDEAIARSVMEA